MSFDAYEALLKWFECISLTRGRVLDPDLALFYSSSLEGHDDRSCRVKTCAGYSVRCWTRAKGGCNGYNPRVYFFFMLSLGWMCQDMLSRLWINRILQVLFSKDYLRDFLSRSAERPWYASFGQTRCAHKTIWLDEPRNGEQAHLIKRHGQVKLCFVGVSEVIFFLVITTDAFSFVSWRHGLYLVKKKGKMWLKKEHLDFLVRYLIGLFSLLLKEIF